MRWMICWHDGMRATHYPTLLSLIEDIAPSRDENSRPGYRARLLIWLRAAQLGDVLEFPLGIVVRTSEYATEIGYDLEETGS